MKTNYVTAAVGVMLCGLVVPVQAAVDFTVSPSTVTTASSGKITLAITGFTAGQSIRIDRVLDLNGNGVIDANEPIVDSVIVKDGVVTSIGGVRNGNVPGDEDGAADGQATVRFHFPGVNTVLDNITGNYLFRVSDPNGVFADVVHTFQIQPNVLAQGVTGTLFKPDGTTPQPNAVVLLISNGSGGGGAVTDSGGHFTIYSAAGKYTLLTMGAGYMSDQAAGSVTVSAGVIGSHNVTSVASDRTIKGNVSDSADSHGLPGVLTIGQSSGGKFSITFTDLSGNYSLPAMSDQWTVELDGSAGADGNYVGAKSKLNVDATSGSVTAINFQLTKATVLVYGTVMDNLGNPVPMIDIRGNDTPTTFEGGGLSYSSGNYFAGLLPGTVYVSPSGDTLTQLGYALVSQTDNLSVVAGQAYVLNFTLKKATTHLRGHVLDYSSNPVSSLAVSVSPVNGGSSVAETATGSDGSFDLAVVGGTFQFNYDSTDLTGRGLVAENLNITVVDAIDQNNISLVLPVVTAHITGTVSTNTGGHLANVGVYAQATINSISYSAYVTTASNGTYSLGVVNGTWYVSPNGDALTALGYNQPSGQSVTINGADGVANFTTSLQAIARTGVGKARWFDQTGVATVAPRSPGFGFAALVAGGDTSSTFPAAESPTGKHPSWPGRSTATPGSTTSIRS